MKGEPAEPILMAAGEETQGKWPGDGEHAGTSDDEVAKLEGAHSGSSGEEVPVWYGGCREKDGWEAHGGLHVQGAGPGDGGHAGHLYVGGRELCQCGSGEVPQCQAGVLDEGGNWCGEGALKEESELIRGFLSSYLLIVFWINLTTNMFNRLGSLVLS